MEAHRQYQNMPSMADLLNHLGGDRVPEPTTTEEVRGLDLGFMRMISSGEKRVTSAFAVIGFLLLWNVVITGVVAALCWQVYVA